MFHSEKTADVAKLAQEIEGSTIMNWVLLR